MATHSTQSPTPPAPINAGQAPSDTQNEQDKDLLIVLTLFKDHHRLPELKKMATDKGCIIVLTFETIVGFCIRKPEGVGNPFAHVHLDDQTGRITISPYIDGSDNETEAAI